MKSETMIFTRCPIGCEQALKQRAIQLPEGFLRSCPECGQLLSACSKQWFDESMQEFDVPEGTLPTGKNRQRYHHRMGNILNRAKQALSVLPETPRLLDVGCSSGALLLVAKECGYESEGVEPARQAAATAAGMGFKVFPGLLQDAGYADNSFDVVTLFEVIEHLLEPAALLKEIRRILKPGGLLLIGTGNADSWTVKLLGARWEYFDIRSHGGHISFFNPNSIALLAERCDFHLYNVSTKRVNLAERGDISPPLYALSKIIRELLAIPAHWLNKGHDMLVILKKPSE